LNQYFEKNNFSAKEFEAIMSESAEFVECLFLGIDFTACNLGHYKFIDCQFNECNFSNVGLKGASFRGATFRKSKLIGLNWSECQNLVNASFYESLLDYSVFHSMNLKGVIFSDCKMNEVDFYESKLMKSSFGDCSLRGANFNKANLSEADLRTAHDYMIDLRYTIVSKAKFNLPEALSLFTSLDIILE
jgi:fluoroquinolone resistance protein